MLADFIRRNEDHILKEWDQFARSLPPGEHMSQVHLRNHGKEILQAIADDMQLPQDAVAQVQKSRGRGLAGPLDHIAEAHAAVRRGQGFEFGQLMAEYRALRATVIRLWGQGEGANHPDHAGMIRFNEAIDQLLTEAVNDHIRMTSDHRDRFTAMLGHDLRTPLVAISLSAERLLRSNALSDKHVKIVGRIVASAQRMQRMVGALLNFTRARFGRGIPIEPVPAHLDVVCQETLDEIHLLQPDIALTFDHTGDLSGTWDRDRLAEVVSNLVTNAIAHGDHRRPIEVVAQSEGDTVALKVHNDGPPIPAAVIDDIFEPFVSHRSRDIRKYQGGLGLGLYIVSEIVHAHGGQVTAASSADMGTQFVVRLPRHANKNSTGTDPAGEARSVH